MEVVGDPSADPMPEGVHPLGGAVVGDQEVGSVCEDGEEKAHRDPVGQERAGSSPRRGESFDCQLLSDFFFFLFFFYIMCSLFLGTRSFVQH